MRGATERTRICPDDPRFARDRSSSLFEQGELRFVRLGDQEVVNRIYVAVRDRNWDTAPPLLSRLEKDIQEDSFRIAFDVDCRLREIDFAWKGRITGDARGTIAFSMEGVARSTFLKNRIGFCILHPDSCAGASVMLTHPDKSSERSSFPKAISPHQPFLGLCGISHQVSPEVWAELLFEGDVFETEDQRNWTDASFKTYCTPLELPFPAEVAAGSRVTQSVTLRLRTEAGGRLPISAKAGRRASPLCSFEMEAGSAIGPMPPIGLSAASHGVGLSARERALLLALAPDHLRVDLDLAAANLAETLRRASEESTSLGAGLHAAIFLSEEAEQELATLLDLLEKLKPRILLWLVFKKGEACTTDRWVAAARKVLGPASPASRFASGTNAYFTELNRGTPPGSVADCIVYSINPQIHAFDNFSLMETLSAQAATVESAMRISGGRPIVVSPVTLKPRFNAVATGPIPPVPPGQLPPQVDPRQMSLFAAAWTIGSVSSLSRAGAASLTYFETTGWRGVMETEAGPPVPQRFPALPGCVYPLYHVLADIREMSGSEILGGTPRPSRTLAGMTLQVRGRRRTLIANLGPENAPAVVRGVRGVGRARVRYLDESTVERACRMPDQYRGDPGTMAAARRGDLELKLLPYAVARIDWED